MTAGQSGSNGTRHQCQDYFPSLEGACRNTTTTLTRAEIDSLTLPIAQFNIKTIVRSN